jgi:hypothetical protein
MATYVPILDTQLDPDAPLTSQLMYQLRDNTLAIAESDTTVPAAYQIGHRLLGTLTAVGVSTVTLSGLNLNPFRYLKLVFDGVQFSGAGNQNYFVGGKVVYRSPSSGESAMGLIEINLSNGIGASSISNNAGGSPVPEAFKCTLRNSSTSVSVSISGSTFSGIIRIEGVQ